MMLSFSLSFRILLASLHASPRAHRSLSFRFIQGSFLEFWRIRTPVCRRRWTNYSERWTFTFSDVCVRSVACENCTRRINVKTFVLFRKIDEDLGGSMS